MVEKHLKKCSTSLAIREMQNNIIIIIIIIFKKQNKKPALRFHLVPVKMSRINNIGTTRVGKGMEPGKYSFTAGGSSNLYSHCGRQCVGPQENRY
jgi:ribosomal protein L16/L10AE